MKSMLLVFVVGLVLVASSLALDGSDVFVQLYTPGNNATLTGASQEFVYAVMAPEDAKACQLVVDGNVIRSFPNIERRKSSKFQVSLPSGEYTWKISCELLDGATIVSEVRTVTVNVKSGACIEKIFKGQGSYRYVFTLGCVKKAPIVLSDVRVNDWLEFKFGDARERVPGGFESKETYMTVYFTKLAKTNGVDYMQFYTSIDGQKVNLKVGESALVNADTVDLNVTLNKVESKKARLTLVLQGVDYTESLIVEPVVTEPTPPVVTPEEVAPTTEESAGETTAPDTGGADTGNPQILPVDTGTKDTSTKELEEKDTTKFWVTIGIIVILLAIVGYLFLSKPKKHKEDQHKEGQHKAEEHRIETPKEEHKKQKKQKEESQKQERKDEKRDEKKRDDSHFIIEVGDGMKKKKR